MSALAYAVGPFAFTAALVAVASPFVWVCRWVAGRIWGRP
jgi:hypothetical protein